MDITHRRAGQELLGLSRQQALDLACTVCDRKRMGWVRSAYRAGQLDAKCLGRFLLENAERPDLRWPAVAFVVASRSVGGRPSQQALLSLYFGPDEKWSVADEEPVGMPDGERRLVVSWAQYSGDSKGLPGVVNGDDAGGQAELFSPERPVARPVAAQTIPPAASDDDGPPEPPPASARRRRTGTGTRGSACPSARRPSVRAGPPRSSPAASAAAPTPSVQPASLTPKQEILLRFLRLLDG